MAFLLTGTLLTATMSIVPALAERDHDDDEKERDGKDGYGDGKDSKSGDGIKQKVEDHSVGNIADCDQYWIGKEFEDTEFQNEQIQECIAAATREGDINNPGNGDGDGGTPTPDGPPEEEPPETATLSVCKDVRDPTSTFEPEDFEFTVTGNSPVPDRFPGDNEDGCVDVTIGPGEYTVSEAVPTDRSAATVAGDCVEESREGLSATGEIQAGETQECRFINAILLLPEE